MKNIIKENHAEEKVEIYKKISPRYLLTIIKPILADEMAATFRFDRNGLKVTLTNGQKF